MVHEYNEKKGQRQITFRIDEGLATQFQILLALDGQTTSAHLRECIEAYVQANKYKINLE